MQFQLTDLKDARLVFLDPMRDERGFFARTFCVDEFAAQGLETNYPQHSISMSSRRGTVRGMHFQRAPHGEVKLVRCLRGAIWDVIIDIRQDSPTYCRWQGFELSESNNQQVYIPKGFAHGFQTLSDEVVVNYLISIPYAVGAASGLRHDDNTFNITWPLAVTTISDKDQAWPDFVRDGVTEVF